MHFLLTVNDHYVLPAKLCIKSLLEYSDPSNISSIIINDTGLSDSNRSILENLHPSVRFISSVVKSSDYRGLHSNEWLAVVGSKTVALRSCIENNQTPLIMLDCDQFILSDISKAVDTSSPVVVCRRTTPITRLDGIVLDCIGSAFIAMNRDALEFVDRWIERINQFQKSGMTVPYETPALCAVAREFSEKDSEIAFIDDEIISSPNKYIPGKTIVYHYKSDNTIEATGNIFLDRSAVMEQQLPEYFIEFLSENLDSTDLLSIPNSNRHSARHEWNPPDFILDKARNLSELSIVFRSDKGPLKHNYTEHYARLLERYTGTECRLLEIGVANGSSLKMWSSFLKDARVHGIDIDPACNELCADWSNIEIHIGDAKTATFDAMFDVIIDDGSHVSEDIFANFMNLWPSVSPGGLYIIEDTYCTFTLSQAKYNPLRSLSDYRRGKFLKLIDLVLWNLDQREAPSSIASVSAYPEFLCIEKSMDGKATLIDRKNAQYRFRAISEVFAKRAETLFRRKKRKT